MTWEMLMPVIARYGVEFAYELWNTIKDKHQPTEEDWQIILTLARKPMAEYIQEAKARAALSAVPQPPAPNG